jgi:hypothetical protein
MDGMLGFKQFIVEMAIGDYSKSKLTTKHHEVALAEAIRDRHGVKGISTHNESRLNQIQEHPDFKNLVDEYKNKLDQLHKDTGIKGTVEEVHWHDHPSHIKRTFGEDTPEHSRGADISLKTSDGVHHHLDFKSSPKYSLRTAGEKHFSSINARIDRGSLTSTAESIADSINKLKSPSTFVRELINGQEQDEEGKHFSHKVVRTKTGLGTIRNDKHADELLKDSTTATTKGNSVFFGRVSMNVKPRTGKEERLNVAVRKREKESDNSDNLVHIYSGEDQDHIASFDPRTNTFYKRRK